MKLQLGKRKLAGAVGVAAAGLAGAESSDAAVVHMNVSANVPPEYNVNLGGGDNEFKVTQSINAIFQPIGTKVDSFAGTTFGTPPQTRPGMAAVILDAGNMQVANLALGTLIDSSDSFTTPAVLSKLTDQDGSGNFNGTSGYMGVQFQLNGNTHYGYVGYQSPPGQPRMGNVFAIVWEDQPNTGVLAGGIPEPSSLALLAAGAAGLSAYRRRKSA